MSDYSRKLLLTSTILFLITSFTACDLSNTNESQQTVPQGLVQAEFFEAETNNPLAGLEVMVSAAFEGDETVTERGMIPTNQDGMFEGLLRSQTSTLVTKLVFEFVYNGVEYSFEEDVNLQLRTEGELDRVEFTYFVGQQEEDEGTGENGDEGDGE